MNIRQAVQSELEKTGGLLRLAPCWVPRMFPKPGLRLRLDSRDLHAFGKHRGAITERWLASTVQPMNENRRRDEGLSYIVAGKSKILLKDVIDELRSEIIGKRIWAKHKRWPVLGKLFDTLTPIPHHMHQSEKQAALVGLSGKPEGYYFPPQYNKVVNQFPFTFFGLVPGTTRAQVRKCLENWKNPDNGILNLSQAYRLVPGTGWLVGPSILHAPGSLCTYEPQWASDVGSLFQSNVDGKQLPWSALVRDMPRKKHRDIDFILDQLDWPANLDPHFKQNHYLPPIVDVASRDFVDKWIVYGKFRGRQLFTAKELTVQPGVKVAFKDNGAYGAIAVQGHGWANNLRLRSPTKIRFGELTHDEFFCTENAASAGVVFENTSRSQPLVILRHFGPEANPKAPVLKYVGNVKL